MDNNQILRALAAPQIFAVIALKKFMIRHATSNDIPALASTYVAAFKEVDPSEVWTEGQAAELVKFFLRAQADLAFVAEHNGKIVGGICGLAKPWWDGVHLVETEIFLDPSAQRKGLGTGLFLHYLEEAARLYKATKMEAITFKGLEFPSSWYDELGFEDKADWKVIFGDVQAVTRKLRAGADRAITKQSNLAVE